MDQQAGGKVSYLRYIPGLFNVECCQIIVSQTKV